MPKLLNQESLNKLMSMPNDSNLIAMGNSIRGMTIFMQLSIGLLLTDVQSTMQ